MELKPTQNPFFNRGAIEESRWFYGRERELREIFKYLDKPTPQSISLVGQRKIGKTSLLRHLCRAEVMSGHMAEPQRLVLIPLNFEGMAYYSEMECLQKILWDTHSALAARGFTPPEDFKIDLLTATPFRIVEAMGKLFGYLASQGGTRVVYLFDEFEVSCYNPHLTLNFFNTLRSFASNYGAAYVVATRRELYQLPVYRMGRSSPFFNYFTTVYLGLYSPDEARLMIRGVSEPTGVSLVGEEAHLIRRAGCFPFFLQLLCWFFWEEGAEENPLADANRRRAERTFTDQATPHFDRFWSQLSEEEKGVARKLAAGRALQPMERGPAESLERSALAWHENGTPRLFSEAFSAFVRSAPSLPGETSPPDRPA